MKFIKTHFPRQSPTKIQDLQQLAIAIFALKFNPSQLTVEFLHDQNIVPPDQQVISQTPLNNASTQIIFPQGVKIVTSPNVITFSQNLGSNQLKVPEIAGKYIEKYPEADYGKINIIFRRILSLPGGSDQARKYIKKNLLANGPWLEFGNNVGVGINFFFQLERCQLKLSINEANLKYQKRPASPALFFSGNFNYKLESYRKQERLLMLGEIIKNWQQDEKTFREIINQSF